MLMQQKIFPEAQTSIAKQAESRERETERDVSTVSTMFFHGRNVGWMECVAGRTISLPRGILFRNCRGALASPHKRLHIIKYCEFLITLE